MAMEKIVPLSAITIVAILSIIFAPDILIPQDTDGDGVDDSIDLCPTHGSGIVDEDGCPVLTSANVVITGQLRDRITGEALTGAEVSPVTIRFKVGGQNGGTVATAFVNADGIYGTSSGGIPRDDYTIVAQTSSPSPYDTTIVNIDTRLVGGEVANLDLYFCPIVSPINQVVCDATTVPVPFNIPLKTVMIIGIILASAGGMYYVWKN